MLSIFKKLTNDGETLSAKPNMEEKIESRRFFHFSDAEGVVEYNKKYGSGDIQSSIMGQLISGNADMEMVKDWGIDPVKTYNDLAKIAKKHDKIGLDSTKKQSLTHSKKRLTGLMYGVYTPLDGTLGTTLNAVKALEVVTKLFGVVVSSLSDLGSLSMQASLLGESRIHVVGNALKLFLAGMSEKDKEHFADTTDVFRTVHNGSLNESLPHDSQRNKDIFQKVANGALTVSGLHRWDWAVRTALNSMLGRHFAKNRSVHYDNLHAKERNILDLYGINKVHHEIFRASETKGAGSKIIQMPDSVQYIPDERVAEIMKENGVDKTSKTDIENMKNNVESLYRNYFSDRMDHVVQRSTVNDKLMMNFGEADLNRPMQFAMHIVGMFKSFGVSFVNRNLASMVYSGGARNAREVLSLGKFPFKMTAEYMLTMTAFGYVSLYMKNYLSGYSAPSLEKPGTWISIFKDMAGFYKSVADDLNLSDLSGSLGHMFLNGPLFSNIENIFKVGVGAKRQYIDGKSPKMKEKAMYSLLTKNIPYGNSILKHYVWDNYLLKSLRENMDPQGIRSQDKWMESNFDSKRR